MNEKQFLLYTNRSSCTIKVLQKNPGWRRSDGFYSYDSTHESYEAAYAAGGEWVKEQKRAFAGR